MESVFSRLLAAQHQQNHTVYDENWKVLRTWVKNPNAIGAMSFSAAEIKYIDKIAHFEVGHGKEDSHVHPINLPLAQGVGVSQRIGNHVQATGIRLAVQAISDSAEPVALRMFILRTPAIATGIEFPVAIPNILALPGPVEDHYMYYALAPRVLEQQKSSGQMIYDNTVTLSARDGESSMRILKTEIELDARVLFKNETADAITTNAYVLYVIPSYVENASCTVSMMTRFLYTDS